MVSFPFSHFQERTATFPKPVVTVSVLPAQDQGLRRGFVEDSLSFWFYNISLKYKNVQKWSGCPMCTTQGQASNQSIHQQHLGPRNGNMTISRAPPPVRPPPPALFGHKHPFPHLSHHSSDSQQHRPVFACFVPYKGNQTGPGTPFVWLCLSGPMV